MLLIQGVVATAAFSGSISGKVLTGNSIGMSHPVAGATITAIGNNPSGDSLIYTAVSDSQGTYLLENMAAGVYSLECVAESFLPAHKGPYQLGDSTNLRNKNFNLNPRPAPNNTVSGSVKNSANNQPVGNATIKLSNENNSYSQMTSWGGNFYIQHIASGSYTLTAKASGFDDYTHSSSIGIGDSTVITGVEILLTPATGNASVSGTVTDSANGTPIVGAEVELYGNHPNPNGGDYYTTTTDSNGAYSFENLFNGSYGIYCNVEGYEEFDEVVEVSGTTTFNINLIHFQSGVISGTVTSDESNEPIAHASINIFSTTGNGHRDCRVIHTDSTGHYSATVPTGEYYVSCFVSYNNGWDGYFEYYDNVHTLSEATPITITDGSTSENINFGIPTSVNGIQVTVSGTVTDEQNTPIEGAKVRVFTGRRHHHSPSASDSNWALTDASGNYQITVNSPSPYLRFIVGARKDGYLKEYYNEQSSWWNANVLTASTDTTFSGISFTLANDTVSYDNSISGNVTDANGQALADVEVTAFSSNHGHQRVMTTTDSLGNYSLSSLRTGNYIVLFFAEGLAPEFYDNATRWEDATQITANGNITGINAVLDTASGGLTSPGVITGIIKDANNNPLDGTVLFIKNVANQIIGSAMTSANGSYIISGLEGGDYTLTASVVGYVSASSSVVLDVTQSNTVVANMKLSTTVLGVQNNTLSLPKEVELYDSYPNPFNPSTLVSFSIPEGQFVKLAIYNVLGQKVKELVGEYLSAGTYSYVWDASDNRGNKVASGMYLYRLEAGATTAVKKMLLMK